MNWLAKLLTSVFYVRIGPDRVSIDELHSGSHIDDVAALAVKDMRVAAVGREAVAAASKDSSLRLVYPFRHPRSLFGDFTVAEKLIQFLVRELCKDQIKRPMTVVVVQPVPQVDGGLTDLERRALRELMENAGAGRVFVHEGPELLPAQITDEFIKNLSKQ